jgi:NADH-quinone oxidoreductase subunit D
MERLVTEHSRLELGIYHRFLPGPFQLQLDMDGEMIVAGTAKTGFTHRGLEKAITTQKWAASLLYADRLDPESAIFGEYVVCLAVEEIAGIAVPPRARSIRIVLSELARISAHLMYFVRLAKACSAENLMHYALRDREKLLDLFELITGSRFSHNYFRFGGVREDITDGFIERVLDVCSVIEFRLNEYSKIFFNNSIFLKRSVGVGTISRELALGVGLTGPNARASGVFQDLRKDQPYGGYESVTFQIPGGTGCVNGRLNVRVLEILESIKILRQVVEHVPAGEYSAIKSRDAIKVPRGEAYARIESVRGVLGCYVVSSGGDKPERVQFRSPTSVQLGLLSDLLVGMRLEDLPVVLASLDLSLSEADR